MPQLRAAGKFKSRRRSGAFQTELQRRFGIHDLGDLAEVFEAAIGAGDRRPAERTDDDDRSSRP